MSKSNYLGRITCNSCDSALVRVIRPGLYTGAASAKYGRVVSRMCINCASKVPTVPYGPDWFDDSVIEAFEQFYKIVAGL